MNKTEEKALKILDILHNNKHESYIVGGYVRDKLLNRESNDIDICTSATPKEIIKLFPNTSSPNYGSINIVYKNTNFDITTFRRDIKYQDNRLPIEIQYIKSIKQDLLRRDFTINTFCINKDGKVKDYLNATKDLKHKIIRTVGNPKDRLQEDSLRILRAIRFATILDFEIEPKTKRYITKYAPLLEKLSYQRKKQELDKIFTSNKKERGIKMLVDLGVAKYLNLPNLENITPCDDLIGIWTQANVDNIYPFTKIEKSQMRKIREILKQDLNNPYTLYTNDLYNLTVAYQIKKESVSKLNKKYAELPIHSSKEISINGKDISNILNKEPGNYIKDIITDLEKQILNGNLPNKKEKLEKYIIDNYKN